MEEVSSSLRTGEEEGAALRQLMQFAVQWIDLDLEAYGVRWTRKKKEGISMVVGDSEDNTPVSLNFWANFFSFAPENHNESQCHTVRWLYYLGYISLFFACFFFLFL